MKAAKAVGRFALGKLLKVAIAAIGGGWIILILALCLIGGFVVLAVADSTSSDSGGSGPAALPAEVEFYRPTMAQYCEQEQIAEYTELLLAIMAHESGGVGGDVMGASHTSFNTQYPQTPGGIKDPVYSIECGVKWFKHLKGLAGLEGSDNLALVKLVLQAYNFGAEYIPWAQSHADGGYSAANAKEYAEMRVAQDGASSFGNPNYVFFVMNYWKPAGYNGEGPTGTGQFLWPVPEHHQMTTRFGEETVGGPHRGLDITGADCLGADIVAADDGVVITVECV